MIFYALSVIYPVFFACNARLPSVAMVWCDEIAWLMKFPRAKREERRNRGLFFESEARHMHRKKWDGDVFRGSNGNR